MSLRQAITHLAICKGAPEDTVPLVMEAIEAAFSISDVQMVNVELTTLSEDELDSLCHGEGGVFLVSELTRRLLTIASNHEAFT